MDKWYLLLAGSLFISLGAFYLCRQNSAYYDELRWGAFFPIKSPFLCRLLISPSIKGKNGRLVPVAPRNEQKITCLGLLSHLVSGSLAVQCLLVTLQYGLFQTKHFDSVQKAMASLAIAAMAFAVLGTINQSKVG